MEKCKLCFNYVDHLLFQLYSGRGLDYHLWLRPPGEIFLHHHADSCSCKEEEEEEEEKVSPGCYEPVSDMTCTTAFREAHRIIENGFDVRFFATKLNGG